MKIDLQDMKIYLDDGFIYLNNIMVSRIDPTAPIGSIRDFETFLETATIPKIDCDFDAIIDKFYTELKLENIGLYTLGEIKSAFERARQI